MSVLEDFWYGNIEPSEYDTSSAKEYKEALLRISRNEESLQDTDFGDDSLMVLLRAPIMVNCLFNLLTFSKPNPTTSISDFKSPLFKIGRAHV